MLRGDWLLLRQALVNIVHNAIKYTPRGGTVTLRLRSVDEQVLIEVVDTGPGIPENSVIESLRPLLSGRGRSLGWNRWSRPGACDRPLECGDSWGFGKRPFG